ncbi:hypothetical protein PAXRUDRAFT_822078 [Paxillus rubicundulus Ve08.2h10]|uniref:Uncharacterized protein n=1 Tax=Paxillus rubicundulus Ve08.2h10 TaxID=930991 RepID=A0A0D0EA72_9AGAM|nr:hypothetical protein PAXRUDRAFT_822078 [Paxillus rubicundulus Ve08.2h10]
MKLQIEWKSSHYHSDGRRRSRPKASIVHGWLVKWRATFSGNERLRKEGMREMREAKAVRQWEKRRRIVQRTVQHTKGGASKSSFSLWPFSAGRKKQRPKRFKVLSRGSPHASKHSTTTRRVTSPTHSMKPTPTNSRRSSSNRHGAGANKPHRSREASYNSERQISRVTKTKR